MITLKRLLLLVPFLLLLVPSSAFAETAAPQWTVSAVSRPTNFAPESGAKGEDAYVVLVTNSGGAASSGAVTVTDELPQGLVLAAGGASGETGFAAANVSTIGPYSGVPKYLECVLRTCTYTGPVAPDETLIVTFPVEVLRGAEPVQKNVVRVAGGGAPSALGATETAISDAPASFGLSNGGETTALSSVQAGAHPDLTTAGAFNTESGNGATAGSAKDITDDLPAGFAGDLVDTPTCPASLFLQNNCPIATQVGITTQIAILKVGERATYLQPVYNLAPEPGEVAKIGFNVNVEFHYVGDISVRAPGEGGPPCAASNTTACEAYGLKTTFYNATGGLIDYDGFALTIWGVPANPIHDPLRFQEEGGIGTGSFGHPANATEAPYFTNPTSCGASLQAELHVTSWQDPHESESPPAAAMGFGPIVGCDGLTMEPSLTAETTSDAAYSATGFNLDTTVPQTYDNAQGVATPTLKKEVVTLPEGMTLNPSSGAGLAACSEAQYAEEGTRELTAQEKEAGHGCPNSSKLASVRIKTPSIEEEVTGSVFLATPYENPFKEEGHPNGSLLALYLIARAGDRGVLVKAPGLVSLNRETGRITTTFDGLPPLPFSLATFAFNQGANAPLVTPATCGNYTVTAELTPYSDPEGLPLAPLIPPFPIDASCPSGNVPPFNPGVTAYPVHGNAGAYSPLYLKITRQDGEQEITGFSTQFPAGLTGNLSGVAKCSEAEVQRAREQTGVEAETTPACPQGSEIGYSIAEAGVGSVLAQNPGKIYLGEKFEGAPFSVVAVTAAHVGPFDLGTVVIHFPLVINRETAAVSIPSGPSDQIPHIIKGIVVHLRNIRAYINREDFMINPTSCTPSTLAATVYGNGPAGNTVGVGDPFNATANCQALRFEPKFTVSTAGKTSKANGASLNVKLTYPTNALGNDANIKQVKVELPVQLPSRLTTLQKACTKAQFDANPAGCPAASLVGQAKAITPILPVPLEGPAYFVSNGNEAFPNLIMVLQGDGVTIDLVGDTFISKTGVTSSTFKTVPDQPVSSFELELPEKQYSALAANTDLCKPTKTVTVKKKVTVKVKGRKKIETKKVKKTEPVSLTMPTEFVAQNGAVIHQTTAIGVTGCPKARPVKKAHKKPAKRGRKR